jgi:type IV secretory pathway component VirB8
VSPANLEVKRESGKGLDQAQDQADVVKRIQANRLPREFAVEPGAIGKYIEIREQLQQRAS